MRTDDNQGIINLVLKKNENNGLKGTFSFRDTQRDDNSQNGNISLDYQRNKLNLSTSLSYNKQ
jgi:hypothetical protein